MKYVDFILSHWAIASSLLLFLLANFITAATEHPDVVPDSALKYVKFAAQFLSLLTHSGSDATFKTPLSMQAAPGALRGHTRLAVLCSLVFACFTISACQFFAPTLKADLLACGAAVTKDVEAQVAATLLAGAATWQSDLYKLGEKVGNDGLVCAIQVAIKDFESQHAVEPASAPQANALTMPAPDSHTLAIARAHLALANLNATPH